MNLRSNGTASEGGRDMSIEKVVDRIRDRRDEHMDVLFDLVRHPSVSAQDSGVLECAEYLNSLLSASGIESRLIPTGGNPVVYGEVPGPGDGFTVLFYGHYDVQPPEPLEEWVSPPFEPTVRDGRIYARGVADNKGQLLCHLLAVRAFLEVAGSVPATVKFVFEGEEESGSTHLQEFVESNRELLGTDLVYVSDAGYHETGRPIVCFGVRGMLAVELEARGAATDVHSGNRGNVVPNPAWRLIDLLNTMRTPDGRVTIAGFYDDVRKPTEAEDRLMRAFPFDPDGFARSLGLEESVAADSYGYAHRLMFEPTFNVNGLASGYAGAGIKTIIPARAVVKLDARLVADQDPDGIFDKIRAHVDAHAPGVAVRHLGAMRPSRSDPASPVARRVIETIERVRGREPVVVPCLGGSLPDSVWTHTLGVPSVLVPYANHDEANHAPNENLEVEAFHSGIETSARVLDALAAFGG
ncbi:MAG: M20/M25/M40 family metallo-hydrolase [Actinomycetota bacterium]